MLAPFPPVRLAVPDGGVLVHDVFNVEHRLHRKAVVVQVVEPDDLLERRVGRDDERSHASP